ncbi:MAG: Gfo/Idh/MocA family oxidoreductase [Actinomycetota bacterium]|nr:Gfo/Idh/MocA family oxidoreductase [Actinomycetota bacterium]
MATQRALRLALVGLGYWGPNLLRAASDLEDVEIAVICDLDPERLALQQRRNPHVKITTRIEDILGDDSIDGVMLASPIKTHHELALRCLGAGKHAFVEKPMAQTSEQCLDLIGCAAEQDLILMPGHTFLYAPAVVAVKEVLDRQDLGEIYFVTSTRVNLGIHQSNSSVLQDLAPHDFSILHYWMGMPLFVRAIGRDSVVRGEWDVAFIDMGYPTGTLVRIELSWLAPTKLRRTVVAGRKGMLVYDDTSNEPIRIHDVGVEVVEPRNFGEHQMAYRTGDIISPRLATDEPLRMEIADFARAIRTGRAPRSDMQLGLDVVRMIEASEQSMRLGGAAIPLNLPPGERRRQPDRRQSSHGMPWFDGPTKLPGQPEKVAVPGALAVEPPRAPVEIDLGAEAPLPAVAMESLQT